MLAQISGIDGVNFRQCSMSKAIWPNPLITKGSNGPMPPIYRVLCLTPLWGLLFVPALVSLNFTIGFMMCLNYFSFRVMAGIEHFVV